MTAQVPDGFVLDGEELSLVGVNGSPLFHPFDHGMLPTAVHTACWRGFIATYGVRDGRLVVTKVVTRLMDGVNGEHTVESAPALFGVRPVVDEKLAALRYDDLDGPVPFTGGLLLGAGFIGGLYVHMGFHPAWKYERVLEVLAESGNVTAVHDRSDAMAVVRDEILAGKRPEPDGRAEASARLERMFSLDYDRSGA
ncbi:MAG TPA: hypothetical protein VF230_10910 [Acidimicrobiales bacterium]